MFLDTLRHYCRLFWVHENSRELARMRVHICGISINAFATLFRSIFIFFSYAIDKWPHKSLNTIGSHEEGRGAQPIFKGHPEVAFLKDFV